MKNVSSQLVEGKIQKINNELKWKINTKRENKIHTICGM
jgi:hypothetical protein